MMLRSFLLLAILFTNCASVWAYSDAEIQQRVQGRLLDRQPSDTPSWWKGLGENAAGVMIGMYNTETNTFHRIRLLQGLSWLDDPQATDFVKQQAEKTDLDTLRNAAIRAIARGEGAKELDWVAQWMKNEDPQTRLAAAESVRDMKDSRAINLYSTFLQDEKTPWLVQKLKGQLGVTGSLKPVASSEDRASPDFEGIWRGYWVGPKPDAQGMQSAAIVLELKSLSSDSQGLSGKLTVLNHKKSPRAFSLSEVRGKGVLLSGRFQESAKKPLFFIFQGGLSRMGNTLLLELKVPEKASVLVLRKD